MPCGTKTSGKKKAIIHQKKPPKHFTVRCLKQFPRARWGGLTETTGLLGVSVWEEIFREKTFALPPPMIRSQVPSASFLRIKLRKSLSEPRTLLILLIYPN